MANAKSRQLWPRYSTSGPTVATGHTVYLESWVPLLFDFRFSLTISETFKLLVQGALMFSAQKLMLLTFPFCVVTVYLVQKIYLRTSRQLRLLDLESQAAVYSSFLESV